jgi:hypothetical protein
MQKCDRTFDSPLGLTSWMGADQHAMVGIFENYLDGADGDGEFFPRDGPSGVDLLTTSRTTGFNRPGFARRLILDVELNRWRGRDHLSAR